MFPGAYISILVASAGALPSAQVGVQVSGDVVQLSWADAEDRLQGSVRPVRPRAGEPLSVSLHVGAFEGRPFDGPLTVTLRKVGETHGQTVTVAREGEAWSTSFVPAEEGPHMLDVSFRSTRHKLVHARLEVAEAALSRLPWFIVLGAIAAALLALGVRRAGKILSPDRH